MRKDCHQLTANQIMWTGRIGLSPLSRSITTEVQRVKFADGKVARYPQKKPEIETGCHYRRFISWSSFRVPVYYDGWFVRAQPQRVFLMDDSSYLFCFLPSVKPENPWPFVVNSQRIFQSYPRRHFLPRVPAMWMHSPYPTQTLSNLLK